MINHLKCKIPKTKTIKLIINIKNFTVEQFKPDMKVTGCLFVCVSVSMYLVIA